jgi:hypothetical protein
MKKMLDLKFSKLQLVNALILTGIQQLPWNDRTEAWIKNQGEKSSSNSEYKFPKDITSPDTLVHELATVKRFGYPDFQKWMTLPHAKKALLLAENVTDASVESYVALQVLISKAQDDSKKKSSKKDRKKKKDDDDDDDEADDVFPPVLSDSEEDNGVLQEKKTKKRAAKASEYVEVPTAAFLKLTKKELKKQFPKAHADALIAVSKLRTEYTIKRDRFFDELEKDKKDTTTAEIFLRDLLAILYKIHGKYHIVAAIKEEDTSAMNTEAMIEYELKLAKRQKLRLSKDFKEPEPRANIGNQGGYRGGGRGGKKCFICGKIGHLQANCWFAHDNNGGQGRGGGGRGGGRGFGRGFGRGGGRGGGRGYHNNYWNYQQQQQLPFTNPPANTQQQPGNHGRGTQQSG